MYKIIKDLTTRNFEKGDSVERISHIVVHYFGALSSAKDNAAYFRTQYRGVSAHYFVDEGEDVYQVVEDKDVAWHSGNKDMNLKSIGIEIRPRKLSTATMNASDRDWYFDDATVERAAELIRNLMQRYNVPVENVIRHYDVNGKLCPRPFVGADENARYHRTGNDMWAIFRSKLGGNKKVAKYIYPVQEYLTITQGYKLSHVGLDLGWRKANRYQPIVATADGTVITAVDGYGNTPNNRIYGNYVIIDHGNGVYSLYGHLLKGINVSVKGKKVRQGELLGFMGNSGYSFGDHLHFELRIGGNSKAYAVDPLKYLVCPDTVVISDASLYRDRIQIEERGIGTPVERDVTRDQIEVVVDVLNARKDASVNADRLGYIRKGFYNVIGEQKAGDYIFYEVEPDTWFASNEGKWTLFYPKEEKPKLYNTAINRITEGDKNKVVALGKEIGVEAVVSETK